MLKKLERAEVVASQLGMSKQAVYEAVRLGLIPAVRVGRRVRFDLDALSNWIQRGGCAQPIANADSNGKEL
jgi:excisionase family DNA binding protein